MKKQNKTIKHQEFLQKFTAEQRAADEFENEQLFEQEAEEGWKLVKNKEERIELLDKKYEEKVYELNKKSTLKGAAPFVAIAASILLLVGLFAFIKEKLGNESKVVSEVHIPVRDTEKRVESAAEVVQTETQKKEVEKVPEVEERVSKKKNKKQTEKLTASETVTENQSFQNNEIIRAEEIVVTGGTAESPMAIVANDAPAKVENDEKPVEQLTTGSKINEEGISSTRSVEKKKRTQTVAASSKYETKEPDLQKDEKKFKFTGGEKAFNDFISRNRRKISELKTNKIFKVKISINTNGKVFFDSVRNSDNCTKCDDEIRRLVNSMPAWEKVKKEDKSTAVEWQEIEIELAPN